MFLSMNASAQLSGTKNIPGDYADLAAAITDLNTQGVGVGGVILNLVAANPQTAPLGGYIIGGTGSLVLTTSSATNPITIQGNGNTITAPVGQTAGNLNDGIFKIIGGDYITISNFTMLENAANVITTAASNDMTEWGVALLYVTTTDGAQNNTISGCTIDLNRTYQNTFGIYSNSTHSATAVTVSATATTPAGSNSGLAVTGNSITDVNIGIVVVGPTAAADHNDGLTIGGSAPNANSITNYGTTGTFSGYANVSGTVNGVLVRNTKNFTVSYNTIASSNGGTTAGTLRGVYVVGFTNAPLGTITNTISNNNISLKSAVATGAMVGIILETITSNATTTLNISNNDFNNTGHTIASSGAITFISYNSITGNATNVNSNTFTNMTVNTTGSVIFITRNGNMAATGVENMNSNSIVTGFSKTGAGGTVSFLAANASSVAGSSITNNLNNFSNITVTGATIIAGWSNTEGASSTSGPAKTITNNTFNNITGGTSAVTGMSINFSGGPSLVENNQVTNITSGGSITGILMGGSNSTTQLMTVRNNLIDPISTTTGTVIGISTSAPLISIYKNKIYDLTSSNSTGAVNGMLISGGTSVDVYNNFIGNLYTPITNSSTDFLRGINITSSTTLSNINLSYNTIYINSTSSGAVFSSTGVFHTTSATATTGQLTMRNNIIVNLSTPNGGGFTVAYRRSSSTLTNYNSASNNNLLYAGTASANNLLYYDITNSAQTIAAYKALVSPRDALSISSNPNFMSTVGSSPNFLHIDSTIATAIESGGVTVAGITTDYDGINRFPNAGYPNNISSPATAPDIGADEFGGIGLDVSPPSITYTPLTNTSSLSNRNLTSNITDASGVAVGANAPRLYYKKSTDGAYVFDDTPVISVNDYTWTIDYSLVGGGSVTGGDIIQYYVAAQDVNGLVATNPGGGSGVNPPGTVPPGTPASYIIVAAPLAGDYTVGSLAFNRLTGKNITFERVVTKVMKEVYETVENDNSNDKSQVTDNTKLNANEVRKIIKEVEEVSYVAMENGKVYNGPLYVKRSEDPNLPLDAGVGVYATLTAAVNDLNLRGLSAPVRFLLKDATYSAGETFPITINTITGGSSVNTLTIQPDSAASTITGSSALALLKLNGADYVTVDGLNTGGKSLMFNNTNTGGVNVWIASASVSDGATNNTMKNLSLIGPSVSGILSGSGTTLGNDAEAPNSNNTITGCTTKGTQNGMYLRGNTTTVDQNWSVTLNNCGSTVDAEKHTFRGIAIVNAQNFTVSNNNIAGLLSTTTSTAATTGIATYISTTGGTIEANKIDDIYQQNTGTYGAYGIDVSAANNITVKNNFISNLRHNMSGGIAFSTTFGVFGIRIGSGTGHMIYYNSVNLYGLLPGTANSALLSAALCIVATTSTGCDMRNNILTNTITGGTTSIAQVSVNMPTGGTSAMNLTWNNNAYYNGSDAARQGLAQVGTTAGTGFYLTSDFNPGAITPSTNFRAYSSTLSVSGLNDNASFASNSAAPFVSNVDLHIVNSSGSAPLDGTAAVIGSVTVDIDNQPRNPTNPDIGADEFTIFSNLTLKFNWEACPNAGPISVLIRNSASPYAVVDSVTGTGGGNVASVINFNNAVNGTSYYIVVKSANSVETWSAAPVPFASYAASYDFTTALSQAYGNNQKLSGGIPSIYQGDANQDGFVNTADVLATYNNSSAFITAPNTDFNCDGTTDLTDVVLAFNNSTNFVQKQRP